MRLLAVLSVFSLALKMYRRSGYQHEQSSFCMP